MKKGRETKNEDDNKIKREGKMIREKLVEIEHWPIRSNICIIGVPEEEKQCCVQLKLWTHVLGEGMSVNMSIFEIQLLYLL